MISPPFVNDVLAFFLFSGQRSQLEKCRDVDDQFLFLFGSLFGLGESSVIRGSLLLDRRVEVPTVDSLEFGTTGTGVGVLIHYLLLRRRRCSRSREPRLRR